MTPIPYKVEETLVTLDKVTMTYDDVTILKDVTGEVRNITREGVTQGQVIGILGPSGTGKTQLCRIMAGLQMPTSGRVLIDGVGEVRPGTVGMVAQNYPLLRHRTVLGNLIVAQAGAQDAEARAMAMLQEFKLEDRAQYYPSQLSGGQRQRVAIAQQLLCSEHYLIMDEPFTGLDPVMKDKTCDLIQKVALKHEKMTIFIVAHDIQSLVLVSDTLWLLGRDRDENGKPIPGANFKARYDLAAMGLAWQPDLGSTRQFLQLCAGIKERFPLL